MTKLLEVVSGIISLLWNGFTKGFQILKECVLNIEILLGSFPAIILSCILCVIAVSILMRVV